MWNINVCIMKYILNVINNVINNNNNVIIIIIQK